MAFLVRLQGRTPREGVMAGHKKFSEKPRGELSSGICKADPKRVGFKIWDSHSQCSNVARLRELAPADDNCASISCVRQSTAKELQAFGVGTLSSGSMR